VSETDPMPDDNAQAKAAQEAETRRAAKLKAKHADAPHPASEPTADAGMKPNPNPDIAPSGALDAEGQRPVLERSRKVR